MKLKLKTFKGMHCETTATGVLLNQIGIELTEPMLFGLGEGLDFIIWKMKTMDFPFMGGRIKPDLLTANIARNLGLMLTVKETASTAKAWQAVKALLDAGTAVGLKLDSYYLEYFSKPFHFAGHYVAAVGYDEQNAFLTDTEQQGGEVSTSLKSLEAARSAKGPMSSKNLYYTIKRGKTVTLLKDAVITAIRNNAAAYLNPPIKNKSYKGIEKAAAEIIKWYDSSKNIKEEFGMTAMLMERAGTGGALFRNLYRDFLKEASAITENGAVDNAYRLFCDIAEQWSNIITLFEKVGETACKSYILEASEKMKAVAVQEKEAMQMLQTVSASS